jgi:PAT family beta-lactamase induction signal transducer AmpG
VKALFAGDGPGKFASAVERSGVSPEALGSGYVVFFAYSALIGVFALLLSVAVERRQRAEEQVRGRIEPAAPRGSPSA